VNANGSGGRAGDPNRRNEESAAKLNTLTSDGSAELGQDELFAVRGGAYSTGFLLPGEEPVIGTGRRDVGMARTIRAADKGERARFVTVVKSMPTDRDWTSDQVRDRLGDTILEPNQFGAILNGCARTGLIRKTGFTTTTRSEGHGRVIATWRRTA
jgi:hypothetical protein